MDRWDFDEWFSRLSGLGVPPFDWQRSLAAGRLRSRVIRIPTGMGKTLGVFSAWSWHRLHRCDDSWPRRLVWCLPQRVLVEQTYRIIHDAIERIGRCWDASADHAGSVGVHLLMGGIDRDCGWSVFPEECAVLIGTQDMLLSRALNRGYGSGRAGWPLEFGLLSHDALWLMDEVQLMDVGLATSAQLQAYHDDDHDRRSFRPRHTWWMSATLQPDWLKSVDTAARHTDWVDDPCIVPATNRVAALGTIPKRLECTAIPAHDIAAFARRILDEHRRVFDGEWGRITLVVCNTVERACRTFDEIRALAPRQPVELVHSRFRPAERSHWTDRFLSRSACVHGVDRVIVSTQVVEAGVDISAGCLITDLAPWSSLVQRFGRCARYGGHGLCVVVDRGRGDEGALPYDATDLDKSWRALAALPCGVGLGELEAFEERLDDTARHDLFPYEPRFLLLRREYDELFDTSPDLSGADIDISRFIRSGTERDVHVFWRDIPKALHRGQRPAPSSDVQAERSELCAVPFLLAREWLCGKTGSRLRPGMRAWVWDWVGGEWNAATSSSLAPGRVVCVAADSGGYLPNRGFDAGSNAPVSEIPSRPTADTLRLVGSDRAESSDASSVAGWKTIAFHAGEVAALTRRLSMALGVPPDIQRVIQLAARWHDVGKAHAAFQGAIRQTRAGRPDRQDIAKAPDAAWLKPPGTYVTSDNRDRRPGLRHELASALALFAILSRYDSGHPALLGGCHDAIAVLGIPFAPAEDRPQSQCEQEVLDCSAEEFDLLVYLVAAHHGKVRVALHAGPRDQDYPNSQDGRGLPIRGVREGDILPSLPLVPGERPTAPLALTLEPAALGLSMLTGRSWRERTLTLAERFGPGGLAWLEALFIAADRRASMLDTADPALQGREAGQ